MDLSVTKIVIMVTEIITESRTKSRGVKKGLLERSRSREGKNFRSVS
jgi:hypothetical protein